MTHLVRVAVTVGLFIAAAGCGVAGSWKRIAIDPPGVPFPLEYVTFDTKNHYTATWKQDGRARTSTGTYKSNLFTLDVAQTGQTPQTYRLHRRLDGKLQLIYEIGDRKVVATLERNGGKPRSNN